MSTKCEADVSSALCGETSNPHHYIFVKAWAHRTNLKDQLHGQTFHPLYGPDLEGTW